MDVNGLWGEVPEPVRARLESGWEWLVVGALAVFMLVSRLKTFDSFNNSDGVWFFGTDAYYHTRHAFYTMGNFPRTLGFDALTQYPLGTNPGQFGTLFDQLAAAMALVADPFVGGGSRAALLDVMTAYPAILGALAVVPIYLLVRDMFDRRAALFSAAIAALLPGSFLIRTIAGFSDHHSIEIVLSTTAVWASYRAFRAWEREELDLAEVYEDPLSLYRDHRRALAVSLGAALAFWAYLAAWPPGVLFVGIVGLWLAFQTFAEVVRDRAPADPIATGCTTFAFLAVLMVPYALGSPQGGFSALNFTWMQPTAPLLVALALAALGGLALAWEDRDLPRPSYPVAALGAGLAGLGLLWLVFPSLVEQTLSGLSWVTGIGVDPTRRTIAEAQPASFSQLGGQFGWLYVSAAGVVALAAVTLFTDNDQRTELLLIVWALLATSGTFTQSRFLYYLAVVVIVLNGYLASRLFDAARVFAEETGPGDENEAAGWTGYHTAVVAFLAVILLPTNVTGFFADCGGDTNAWTQPGCFGGPGESKLWAAELDWVKSSTPQPPLDLTSSFEAPEEGRYEYPEGMYGVLSWWDYGHQIEWDGHRAPVANPFQQQAPLASRIFTAPDEGRALSILDDYLGPGNDARYLMVDDQMASTKFGAITVWAEVEGTYRQGQRQSFDVAGSNRTLELPGIGDEVRGWFLQDVYRNDGTGTHHFRLVKEHPQFSLIGSSARVQEGQRRLTGYNTILARGPWEQFQRGFEPDSAYQVGQNRFVYDVDPVSRLKTYERVPGAELTGRAPAGEEVVATVDLEATASGRAFTYRVSEPVGEDGRFSVTVPYSTTDPVPRSEGGTELSVQAQGPYEVTVGNRTATADVPDRAVLDGGRVSVTFGG